MAEFAISYSHRDEALAARILNVLRGHGRSVWIDEAGDYTSTAEGVNLPWGQEHWKVITDEFAGALTVLVVDTSAWRQSPYCADEYRFLREWGKRVFVLDTADGAVSDQELRRQVDEVVATTDAHSEVLGAHTRLVERTRSGEKASGSRLDALLNRGAAQDARTVFDGDLTAAGVGVPPAVADRARAAIDAADRARRRIRRGAASTVAVLTVLALVGVIAMFLAQAGRRSATAAAARSQALDLSGRSSAEPDTLKAIAYARRAVDTQDTADTRGALRAAEARDGRTRVLTLEPLDFRAAMWSGDGNSVVAVGGASNKRLQSVDVRTGVVRPAVALNEGVRRSTAVVSESGDRLAYRGDSGSLQVVDVHTGNRVGESSGEAVTAVTSVDGTIWYTTGNGSLWSATFDSVSTPTKRADLGAPVAGFAVADGGARIDFVDATGSLRSGTISDGRYEQRAAVPVLAQADLASVSQGGVAAVRRCGDNLFAIVGARAAIKSKFFAQVAGIPKTSTWMGMADAMICRPDNTDVIKSMIGIGAGGAGAPVVPTGARLNLVVSSPVVDRAAVITDAGKLYIRRHQVDRPQVENVVDVFEIEGQGFRIGTNGDVTRAGDPRVLSNVGKYFALRVAGPVGGRVALADPSGIIAIDGEGRNFRLANGDFTGVREGADGKHFVATSSRTTPVLLDPSTGDGHAVPAVGLAADETVIDADIAPGGGTLAAVTAAGRVGTVPVGGPAAAAKFTPIDVRIPASSRNAAAFVAPDRFVVAAADGAVRMFDLGNRLLATTRFGGVADSLRVAGGTVLVSSDKIGTMLLNPRTLEVVDMLGADDFPMTARTVSRGADWVIGLSLNATRKSSESGPTPIGLSDTSDQTRVVYAVPVAAAG